MRANLIILGLLGLYFTLVVPFLPDNIPTLVLSFLVGFGLARLHSLLK